MKKKLSLLEQTGPLIRWGRGFLSGLFGVTMMMGFIDIFFMLGFTPFSYEQYLGSLLRGTIYGHQNWMVGAIANWTVGGAFGWLYAWAFEWVLKKSGGRAGAMLGLAHAAVAALIVFPFFGVLHNEAMTGIYPEFGFFGVGLGAPTPILLLVGHLIFGATVGLLYGPVRAHRVRAEVYEPGESVDIGALSGEASSIRESA